MKEERRLKEGGLNAEVSSLLISTKEGSVLACYYKNTSILVILMVTHTHTTKQKL